MVTSIDMAFPRVSGFTLVEAVVVMALIAISVGLAAPGMATLAVTQQLKNASFDLASSLSLARSEALTRNVEVTIAPAVDGWAGGWTVKDAGGTVLRELPAYGRISVSGPVRVTFNGDGRPATGAEPFAVTAGSADASHYRCVRLRLNGRAYVAPGACS